MLHPLAKERRTLSVINDQYGLRLTSANCLADVRRMRSGVAFIVEVAGLYHPGCRNHNTA